MCIDFISTFKNAINQLDQDDERVNELSPDLQKRYAMQKIALIEYYLGEAMEDIDNMLYDLLEENQENED